MARASNSITHSSIAGLSTSRRAEGNHSRVRSKLAWGNLDQNRMAAGDDITRRMSSRSSQLARRNNKRLVLISSRVFREAVMRAICRSSVHDAQCSSGTAASNDPLGAEDVFCPRKAHQERAIELDGGLAGDHLGDH